MLHLALYQAEKSWGQDRCCEVEENDCETSGSDECYDRTASSDYLYRLSPGDPERYELTGDDYRGGDGQGGGYQFTCPTCWPFFGVDDLSIGESGPPGGYCQQGGTYRGSTNEACGGDSNWGHTDLEVWRLPPSPPPPPPTFPGSQILSAAQQVSLSSWAPQGPTQQWTLCFSSFTDDASDASVFHSQCDEYDVTMVVARNSLGYTFGGYVRSPCITSFLFSFCAFSFLRFSFSSLRAERVRRPDRNTEGGEGRGIDAS
eukprot:COSAG06_NODE_4913_length_3867_cov_7.033439_2_plen_259_part_00